MEKTAIYLVCFHSEKPKSFAGAKRQFLNVETAIGNGDWPYDNGDDPSFYVARQGGRLTWGVCRQDLRNPITKDSIVVFFSFTTLANDEILYRLCAVATVDDKVDHRAVYRDPRLNQFQEIYINGLIGPAKGGWNHDESDRRPSQRHENWLWRMADHRGIKKEMFNRRYEEVYRDGWFAEADVVTGKLPLAANYIVFSTSPDRSFLSPHPPEVAISVKGQNETWSNEKLRALTVGKAASLHSGGRDYLRVANSSGRNVHRQLRFVMPSDEANRWRHDLITALREVGV